MGLVVGDAYVNVFNYTASFNLHTKVLRLTDASTYFNAGGVTGIVFTVTFPNTGTSSLTIAANGSGTINLPTLNGAVAYGYYSITATITDTTSSYIYALSPFNLCKPYQCNPNATNSDGCLVTNVQFKCFDNKVIYTDNTSYVYESTNATSVTRSVTAYDPNNIEIANAANVAAFVDSPIVNGRYSFTISNYAVYNLTSNISVTIYYTTTNEQFTAQCDVDLCSIYCEWSKLWEQYQLVGGNGSANATLIKKQLDELATLVPQTQLGIECGQDVSDKVEQIEAILGDACNCGCGSTVVNQGVCSCTNIVIDTNAGLDSEQTTAGDTTTITLSNTDDFTVNNSDGSSNNLTITETTVGQDRTWEWKYQDYYTVTMYVSFDSGYISNNEFSLYGDLTIVKVKGAVVKAIASTDNATVQLVLNGVNVTGGLLTFPASTVVNTVVESNCTANNTYATGNEVVLKAAAAKSTPGGAIQFTVIYKRNG